MMSPALLTYNTQQMRTIITLMLMWSAVYEYVRGTRLLLLKYFRRVPNFVLFMSCFRAFISQLILIEHMTGFPLVNGGGEGLPPPY